MGELVFLEEWKERKELEEIERLRGELKVHMASMPEPEVYGGMPFMEEEDAETWFQRIIDPFLSTLDGYRHWPIDSSDM